MPNLAVSVRANPSSPHLTIWRHKLYRHLSYVFKGKRLTTVIAPNAIAVLEKRVSPPHKRSARGRRRSAVHREAGLASLTDYRVVRDLLVGARREDAGRDHRRATITAERLAAALTLQAPSATPVAIRERDSAAHVGLGAEARRDPRLQRREPRFQPGGLSDRYDPQEQDRPRWERGSLWRSRGSSTGRTRSRPSRPGFPLSRRRRGRSFARFHRGASCGTCASTGARGQGRETALPRSRRITGGRSTTSRPVCGGGS
jgi:hypothetical protein